MPEFRVYVVELSADACKRTNCASKKTGKPHVYVGETKKTPEERLAGPPRRRLHLAACRPQARRPSAPRSLPGDARLRKPDGITGGGGTARRPSDEARPLRVRRPLSPTCDKPEIVAP